jgi:uncharacterized protein (DUF885 family)
MGDRRFDDRLGDPSPEARDAWAERLKELRSRAAFIPESALGEADRLHRALFVEELDADIASEVCRFEVWSFSPRFNPLQDANNLPETHTVSSPQDGENLLARYRQLPAQIDAATADLRAGLQDELVVNRRSAELVVEMFDRQLAADPSEWPLLAPARASHDDWDTTALGTYREDVTRVVNDEVVPALTRYRELVATDILAAARAEGEEGIGALSIGAECYDALILKFTTLQRPADEIHEVGLRELASIHAEFRALGTTLFGTDDLAEIFHRLRTDPELRFRTAEEVEEKARTSLARAEEVVPEWFGRLPELPCEVLPIPDYEAPYTTVAYYRPGSAQADRIGAYFINTYAPETRPRFEAEVLAYHESVPGHHFQIAISQEVDALPAFRRHGGRTAYVEGWALYTERLADQMGLYTGDLDRMGMLSFDAWRAARLVVDTGVHTKGWSRTQAETFLRENTPLATNNIQNEVDRYITWPGQALAYKMGQLVFWELRHEAEEALGDSFDVRGFHDTMLEVGAVTLPVLRARIEAWVAEQKALEVEAIDTVSAQSP